jgi:DNA-binding CsgD family transcriptional regulator/ssRNA-specific RNase YbeY (16S rRNA maturation enzyme)
MTSPYITSNWVEGANFYGREALCQTLSLAQERCIYLVGVRRIGKTSLLKRLVTLMHPTALYCDLMQAAAQGGGGEEHAMLDESRMVRLLRRELSRLPHEGIQATREVWERGENGLVRWLEEVSWQWEEQGITVTLLWDEAEMLRRLPTPTLMGLRALVQNSHSLRLVICASKALAAINEQWRNEEVSPFLFGFKTYYLAALTDEEATLLIRQRGRVQVADATVEQICTLTGNHPFLLQTLCDRLYQDGTLRQPQERDILIDAMMADLFRIDVEHLSPGEQAIVYALAQHGPASMEVIEQQTALSGEVLHSLTHGILHMGYIRLLADGRYAIGNDFLALWLRSAPLLSPSTITDQASLEVMDEAPAQEMETTSPTSSPPEPESLPAQETQSAAAVLEEPLSSREREVLRLMAQGLRNQEIANHLTVSDNTVKAHVKNIYRKLDVHDRVQAVNRGRELGVL